MKKLFLAAAVALAFSATAQLEKKDFLAGINFGLNNQFEAAVNDAPGFTGTAGLPFGINLQYMLADRISLGLHYNVTIVDYTYFDGTTYFTGNAMGSTSNLYSVYHYVNREHFSLGSGLSLGITTAQIEVEDVYVGDSEFRFDVVLADAKYIFKEHFGLQANLYLLDGYNTIGSIGAFWRF